MAKTATLSIRIEPKIKSQAEKLFAHLGISMSEAMSLFLHQCVNDRALPFRPHLGHPEIPNDETLAAMAEVNRMIVEENAGTYKPKSFKSVEELFADLET